MKLIQTSHPVSDCDTAGGQRSRVVLFSQKEEQLDADEAPPLPRVDIIKRKNEEEEDEESVFPGADFLSVADSVQVTFLFLSCLFSSSSSCICTPAVSCLSLVDHHALVDLGSCPRVALRTDVNLFEGAVL